MSRLPRHQEHLKTGFTAEAVSAAAFRAFAARAEGAGRPGLASRLRALAEAKDALAIRQLEAAGKVLDDERNLRDALAEERFENEVLYPRLIDDSDALGHREVAELFREVVAAQQGHQRQLEALLRELVAAGARGDVGAARDDAA